MGRPERMVQMAKAKPEQKYCPRCKVYTDPVNGYCPSCSYEFEAWGKNEAKPQTETETSERVIEFKKQEGTALLHIEVTSKDGTAIDCESVKLYLKAVPMSKEFEGVIRDMVGEELFGTAIEKLSDLSALNALMKSLQ